MAPPGTKVVLHDKPSQRLSWDPHDTEGWFLGTALEHYRCYCVFVNKTKSERVTHTLELFPPKVTIPYATPTDVAIQVTAEITRLLHHPNAIQVSKVGTNQIYAIKQLASLFKKHRPDKASTPISSPKVPDNVTSAPSPRVPNKAAFSLPPQKDSFSLPLPGPVNNQGSYFTRVATHPRHRYPTRHTKGLPQQANSGVTLPSHWANAIIDPISGASMQYRHLVKILSTKFHGPLRLPTNLADWRKA